jgi:hypothetical protein
MCPVDTSGGTHERLVVLPIAPPDNYNHSGILFNTGTRAILTNGYGPHESVDFVIQNGKNPIIRDVSLASEEIPATIPSPAILWELSIKSTVIYNVDYLLDIIRRYDGGGEVYYANMKSLVDTREEADKCPFLIDAIEYLMYRKTNNVHERLAIDIWTLDQYAGKPATDMILSLEQEYIDGI